MSEPQQYPESSSSFEMFNCSILRVKLRPLSLRGLSLHTEPLACILKPSWIVFDVLEILMTESFLQRSFIDFRTDFYIQELQLNFSFLFFSFLFFSCDTSSCLFSYLLFCLFVSSYFISISFVRIMWSRLVLGLVICFVSHVPISFYLMSPRLYFSLLLFCLLCLSSHSISFSLISCLLISSNFCLLFCLILLHLNLSCLLFCLFVCFLFSSHCISFSVSRHLVSSHFCSFFHFVSSYCILSHFVWSHLMLFCLFCFPLSSHNITCQLALSILLLLSWRSPVFTQGPQLGSVSPI